MHAIEYERPETLDQAVAVLASAGRQARPLAGGTDLIVQLREGRRPDVTLVVDVKKVPELNALVYDPEQGLTLGAAVPCYRITSNAAVVQQYPAIIDSASLVGGTAIQGRATFGGNLCTASPAADTVPTMFALGTQCVIAGPNGTRTIPVEAVPTGPGRTSLQEGEMLVAFRFPPPAPRSGARFLRFIPRNEMDIAVVNAAAWLQLEEDERTIRAARVAIGAVAPTCLLVQEAAAELIGHEAGEEAFRRAAEAAMAAARPISDMRGTIAQRRHLVGVLVRRALEGALARARRN